MRFVLLCFVAACGGPPSGAVDAALDRAVGDSGSTGGGDVAADAPVVDAGSTTPIALADQWVRGWYASTSDRGINRYAHTDTAYFTSWRGDPDAAVFANVTDCSSFTDILMMRSYGWIPSTSHPRPLAEDYYWAVRTSDHFVPIANVSDIRAGDTLTLLYGTLDATTQDTGHVAWIDAPPVASTGGPAESGLTQYVVTVIDSADGFHYAPGPDQDDRYLGRLDGGECDADTQCTAAFGANAVCDGWQLNGGIAVCAYTGVGRGQIRLYADASGAVAGYAWGPSAGSTFYPRPSPLPARGGAFTGRDVTIGRYTAP